MSYRPIEPHTSHETVGAVLPEKESQMYDESGGHELVKTLISHLDDQLDMTNETLNRPILPLLDQLIQIGELRPDFLTSYEDTRKLYTEENGRIITIKEFANYVDEWLNMAFEADDIEDAYYSVICNIYLEPFMWGLFRKHLPSVLLVDDPKDVSNTSGAQNTRGEVLPMHIVRDKIAVALSSLGVCVNGDAFLTIYAAMAAICRLANSFTDEEFKVLLDSVPVDLVDASPLHQLGMKLITIVVYEFVDRPPGSMIVYREAVKAILENSRWPYFQSYFEVIEKQS